MRSLCLTLIIIPVLLTGSGCKRRHRNLNQRVSNISAADPNVASHFTSGFYGVESNAWRWTAKDFSVNLAPPLNANQKGAELVMKLSVPDAVIEKVNSVTLSASVDGYKLEPETYTKGGQYTFTRDVPADKLQGDSVQINFAVDHTIPPTGSDARELGVIVSQIGLVAK